MNQRQKVLARFTLSVFFLMPLGVLTAFAAGWTEDSGSWKYLKDDGTALADQWRSAGDDWYYLNSNGRMEQNSLFQVDDNYFYVDGDGKRVKEQWVLFAPRDSDGNGYGMTEYWYYFGKDGKAYRKRGKSFKKIIDGETYIFDEDGIMLTGFLNEDGDLIGDEEDPFVEARYYCGDDGAMYRNRWLPYDYQGETDLRSEMGQRDYMDYEQVWLYFDSAGKKVCSKSTDKLVQRDIDGETYGFDDNGVMMSWWSQAVSGDKTLEKYYSGYDGGKLLKSTWVWMYPAEDMNEDDYSNLEYSWWRTDDNGKIYKNRIREIGGQRYAFDDVGRMQTGFLLFDGTSQFVAQYDIDTWESADFKEGIVYGIEKADLYLFGPDQLNGGAMQKGREIVVELADGTHTFGFGANGRAYGNRNKLAKQNNCYYINGLRLEAEPYLKYGVVKVNEEEYRVVNTSGKIVRGTRKLARDGEDGWFIIINDQYKGYVPGSDKPKWHDGPEGEGYYRYDGSSKTYDGLIAGKETGVSGEELPADARLNFELSPGGA